MAGIAAEDRILYTIFLRVQQILKEENAESLREKIEKAANLSPWGVLIQASTGGAVVREDVGEKASSPETTKENFLSIQQLDHMIRVCDATLAQLQETGKEINARYEAVWEDTVQEMERRINETPLVGLDGSRKFISMRDIMTQPPALGTVAAMVMHSLARADRLVDHHDAPAVPSDVSPASGPVIPVAPPLPHFPVPVKQAMSTEIVHIIHQDAVLKELKSLFAAMGKDRVDTRDWGAAEPMGSGSELVRVQYVNAEPAKRVFDPLNNENYIHAALDKVSHGMDTKTVTDLKTECIAKRDDLLMNPPADVAKPSP